MAANKVTYNVGTSNKFAGFYDEGEFDLYARHVVPQSAKAFHDPQVRLVPAFTVPYGVAAYQPQEEAHLYAEDVYDTRARGRRMSRRFRGNPNSARKFDRISGTGRGKELKKQGEGGHNWGSTGKESKSPVAKTPEDNDLSDDLNNLNLAENGDVNAKDDKELAKDSRDRGERAKKNDMMDFESYKLLQQSKRSNLPTFTVNDKKSVSTDVDLQNDGYVKYVKQTEDTKAQEKVKVINSQASSNPVNVLPSHPASFRDRRYKPRLPAQAKPKNTVGACTLTTLQTTRMRVKAPDLADLKLFPVLDLKS